MRGFGEATRGLATTSCFGTTRVVRTTFLGTTRAVWTTFFVKTRVVRTSILRSAFGSARASTATGANSVGGPSRFGDSTASERSRPRNSSGRYSSAGAEPAHTSNDAQNANRQTHFATMAGPPEIADRRNND